jgi:hypothetical protein
MSKRMGLILVGVMVLSLGLAGCGSPCAELRKQCDVCSDATTTGKDACNLLANAGIAEACGAALDRKTFVSTGDLCRNRCPELSKQCESCANKVYKDVCTETANSGSAKACQSSLDSMTYVSTSDGCKQ